MSAWRGLAAAGVAAVALIGLPVGTDGQVATQRFAATGPETPVPATQVLGSIQAPGAANWTERPGATFAGSLLVPGSGQAAMGLRRWLVYGVVEVALVAGYLDRRAAADRFRDHYRDVAWEAARVHEPGAARRDGSWGYYEAMSQYLTSGAFDRDPRMAGLQPETDPATYNGQVWELAAGMYLPGGSGEPGTPAWERALAYYRERAAGPDFLWSWAGSLPELERFRHWIGRSDEAARWTTRVGGLVLANHIVSAIDALLAARLASDRALDLDAGFSGPPAAPRWDFTFRIRTDR